MAAELTAQGMKRCARETCGEMLPLESFNRDRSRTDGRYPYCKQCCVEIDAARRPKQPEPEPSNSYGAVHSRLGQVIGQDCNCGMPAEEWAYDHGDPDELTSELGFPYSLDPVHYKPMCRPCHRKYDADYRKETGTAKPRNRRLKPCAACEEPFWNPSHHRKTCSPKCETELRRRSKNAYEEQVRSATGLTVTEIRGQAALTAEAVRDIRTRHADRSATARELARLYGVSQSTVFRVISREGWRHVA